MSSTRTNKSRNSASSTTGSVRNTSTTRTKSSMHSSSNDEDIEMQMQPLVMTTKKADEVESSASSSKTRFDVTTLTPPGSLRSNTTGTGTSSLSIKGTSSSVLTACGMYCVCSVSMVLTNKSLASSYNYLIESDDNNTTNNVTTANNNNNNHDSSNNNNITSDVDLNILLVVFQAIVAVASVELCKRLRWVDYPVFNMRTARLWAPVNMMFCFMLFTSMASLEHNSVPIVTIFKNITNIIVTIGDVFFFKTQAEFMVMVAFGIMLSGAVAAAWNDMNITAIGVFWMSMNCFSTAGYILLLKFATKNVKLSKFGMVFYNNVLCTFFLLPAAIFRGELTLFYKTKALHTMEYAFKNIFAGFIGFFLNFASLNCVAATGPTTYAIVGSLNKIPVILFGYILFDNPIQTQTWFFIALSMCGGFMYSFAKIQTGRRKQMMAKQ